MHVNPSRRTISSEVEHRCNYFGLYLLQDFFQSGLSFFDASFQLFGSEPARDERSERCYGNPCDCQHAA